MSDKQRFEEIICEMKDLLDEAISLVPKLSMSRARAEAYWYANITTLISHDHDYLGRSMCSMQDTLEELEAEDEEEEEELES